MSGKSKNQKEKKHKKIGRALLSIFCVLLLLAGIGVLLYPTISNLWNEHFQKRLIESYENVVEEMKQEDLSAEWERAWAYNDALQPIVLPDSFAVAEAQAKPDEEYFSQLNIGGDGIMGSVYIPKIDVRLNIAHTTDEQVLLTGAGHLAGSSLPVGGENSHAVIAAHRGLPSAALFTDLNLLAIGDHFYLYILDDVLAYEVDQILVTDPMDTNALSVVEGEDLVTLLTCTPYGVNSHRLLVRGHRIPYDLDTLAKDEKESAKSLYTRYLLWAAGGLLLVLLILLIAVRLRRRKSKVTPRKQTEKGIPKGRAKEE